MTCPGCAAAFEAFGAHHAYVASENPPCTCTQKTKPVTLDEALRLHKAYRDLHPAESADEIGRRVYRELDDRTPKPRTKVQGQALHDAISNADTILTAQSMRAAVFLVWGTEGCYSDRSDWPVKVYPTFAAAWACVERLRAYYAANKSPKGYGSYDKVPPPPDDTHQSGWDGPPDYCVVAVPVGDES